jgi:hypothetical protein
LVPFPPRPEPLGLPPPVAARRRAAGGITDTNNAADLFVYDVAGGTITAASIDPGGTATGNDVSGDPFYFSANDPFLDVVLAPTNYVFSANNQYLFFAGKAGNLVSGITFPASPHLEVFRRDLVNHTTALVTVNAAGTGADNGSYGGGSFSVSSDGSRVAFTSSATNLVPGFVNQYPYSDAYVRDLTTNTTSLVSAVPGSTVQDGNSSDVENPVISPDGRYVAFFDSSTDLVSGFAAGSTSAKNLFLRDLQTGTTVLVTPNQSGTGYGASGTGPAFFSTSDTLFESYSDTLVPGDGDGISDQVVVTAKKGKKTMTRVFAGYRRERGAGWKPAPPLQERKS